MEVGNPLEILEYYQFYKRNYNKEIINTANLEDRIQTTKKYI